MKGNELRAVVDKFVALYRKNNQGKWPLCMLASHVVGKYERGATAELADKCGVDVSTIENYAHAGKAYALLRRKYGRDIDALRDRLTIYHFAVVWEVFLKSNGDVDGAAYALVLALDPPDGKTMWSAGDLRAWARSRVERRISPPWGAIDRLYSFAEANLPPDARQIVIGKLNEIKNIIRKFIEGESNG